jgi:FeS assembly SUF system protein
VSEPSESSRDGAKPQAAGGQGHPLPVLPNSGKVEQLRKEEAAQPTTAPPAKHCDGTLVSRFADSSKTPKQKSLEEKIVTAIRTIYDPEIPVNIYDLGLIYSIDIHPETCAVDVKMTLTAPGCPVAGSLLAEVQAKVQAVEEVSGAEVELVWDPPWSREMMSESARLELGLL